MELRKLTSGPSLTPRVQPAASRDTTPADRLERRGADTPGTYGPSFARPTDDNPGPSRTALKTAGLALATVVAAALCDALLSGGVHRSHK